MTEMSAERLSPLDSMFLYGETPSTMMHVAVLLPFTPPPDAGRDYLRDIVDEARRNAVVESPWNRKLRYPQLLASPLQSWVVDKNIDLDYHLRRSALASPGDERELGVLVSRLHSHPLDLTRPPWELHLIEGLEGGRFAIYIKVHHALVDGYTAMRLITGGLSTDAQDRTTSMFFSNPASVRSRPVQPGGVVADTLRLVKSIGGGAGSTFALSRALFNLQFGRRGELAHLVSSAQAPATLLNVRIGRNRRFATQQYQLSVLKKLGARAGGTVNDVALSIIGGGLRRFLSELDELPREPLIAFVPVNIRPKDDPGGGNSVGAVLVTLGTDIEDPVERLTNISASTRAAKAQLEGMSQQAILAYSALLLAPSALQALLATAGVRSTLPLTFNVCVSNVPGPSQPLFFRGSRLEANYPVSIPVHGAALNVTLQSYADTVNFGFIGDRDAIPHLQRLAVYTGQAFESLAAATEP
jgi:WS/DGAT/MGAT family acyltransferase